MNPQILLYVLDFLDFGNQGALKKNLKNVRTYHNDKPLILFFRRFENIKIAEVDMNTFRHVIKSCVYWVELSWIHLCMTLLS